MSFRSFRVMSIALGLLVAAGCGGGGGGSGGGSPNPPPPPASTTTSIRLTSDAGDYIGGGRTYSYTQANAVISVSAQGGRLSIDLQGDDWWHGDFELPSSYTSLQPGTYSGLKRYPFHDAAIGGISWTVDSRGCNTLTGSFTIKKATYKGGALTEVELQFTQNCESGSAALHGEIYWNAKDTTTPPGPTTVPSGLWQPAAGNTPATGNYIYLESQAGDYVGQGRNYLYTQATAVVSASAAGNRLSIGVNGDELWSGDFQGMNSVSRLDVGYYGNLQRAPLSNPTRGGLNWTGEGRGCNAITGWFAVDAVTYSGSTLISLDLRFEQHCEGGAPALHGKIHWSSNDSTTPPGPVTPPAGLWQPASGVTPASGNYVYLESQSGDYIGQGRSYLYTQANAVVSAVAQGPLLTLNIAGDQDWGGNFLAMNSLDRLEPGYYGDLQRYPFHNPVRGGLSWSGEGRGCNTLTGWFVVDAITYSGSTLTSIDLRFEQHCDGSIAALRGKLHWDASDSTAPPGPVAPPADLWQPAPGVTPATGSYVYLESQSGDYVGQGYSYLYTQATAVISSYASNGHLSVAIDGDEWWNGDFQTMNTLSRLEVGYYGNLQRYPFQNPVRGGLDWSGEGRGCNTLTGWFVVDSATYSGSTLTAIDLRFEQHCEGRSPALRGKIHWVATDETVPPGPVAIPDGLWQPAAGTTPASGNYVYLESQPGDYIGGGNTYLYTQDVAVIAASGSGALLQVWVNGDEDWTGDFQGMNTLTRLEVGYYGNLQRYPFHNPTRGGLAWSGEGRGCNTLNGWFAVDKVTYSGSALQAVDLRFEQHCGGGSPALRGKIHWDANDSATVPGPVTPPAGLWQPAPGSTPSSGNFVYLSSQPGDYIGQGQTMIYTTKNATLTLIPNGGLLEITVNDPGGWVGHFKTMNSVSRFEVGYYGNLQRYPFNNPTKGGLDWGGQGRGCNTLTGWFVVDNATYSGSTLQALDLRFEQHCEGIGPALRGQIHWSQ